MFPYSIAAFNWTVLFLFFFWCFTLNLLIFKSTFSRTLPQLGFLRILLIIVLWKNYLKRFPWIPFWSWILIPIMYCTWLRIWFRLSDIIGIQIVNRDFKPVVWSNLEIERGIAWMISSIPNQFRIGFNRRMKQSLRKLYEPLISVNYTSV